MFSCGDTPQSAAKSVSACRPGFGASCALCCGSHNCDALPDEMDAMYRSRGNIITLYSREYLVKRVMASRSPMTGSYYFTGKRDVALPDLPQLVDGARCPFIGMHHGSDEICCLLHGGPESSLRYDCFRNYSSKNFTCAAAEELGDGEILFAAALCRDWYYYSLLIYCRETLSSLVMEYAAPEDVPAHIVDRIRAGLRETALVDPLVHRMSSYF